MTDHEPMLTVAEIAALLRVSKWTVYRLIEDGPLKAIRVGRGRGSIRVYEAAYKAYVTQCETVAQPERLLQLDHVIAAPPASTNGALKRDHDSL